MQSLGNEEHVFVKISADAYDFYDNQMVNLTRQFLHQDRKFVSPNGVSCIFRIRCKSIR